MALPIVNVSGSPIAANSTAVYTALLVNEAMQPIAGDTLQSMTLTIADTLTGLIINDVQDVNILNTGRGTIDNAGNLTIMLETGDTSLPEDPTPSSVQRSLIIHWSYNEGASFGWHQANLIIVGMVAS